MDDLVNQYHDQLPEDIISWLKNERGLTEEIIDKFKLGWNGKALTIPIPDKECNYAFFKFRKHPKNTSDLPKYWYTPNASTELYGWENITKPKAFLIICEGELDRLTLESNDIPAITGTSGAITFKPEWIEAIGNIPSEIFVCFDNDDAGIKGAERIAERIPHAKIVQIPKAEGVKDITEYVVTQGIESFKGLLDEAKTLSEIKQENESYDRTLKKQVFPPMQICELLEILGLTIKRDEVNKVITFLCLLSAYTEASQFNISFNAPSSTGKSYLPIEISALFPEEDVKTIGYCSPTAFFHDISRYDKEKGVLIADLSRQVLIFLDQPHTLLLQHLRPLLSHDKKEVALKITDKSKAVGLRTKNIIIKGFPSVIFCSAGLRLDEQESTRFFLLSPEISQEKIREAVCEKLRKESNYQVYRKTLEDDPQRRALKERILAIKNEHITDINIGSSKMVEDYFLEKNKKLKPRHPRDLGRLASLIKALALLNLWHREKDGSSIVASEEDIKEGLDLWNLICVSQDFNLPPYVYNVYTDIIHPAYEDKGDGLERNDIIRRYYDVYGRSLPDWQLRREILPALEMSGLIVQEQDRYDRRKLLVYPAETGDRVD